MTAKREAKPPLAIFVTTKAPGRFELVRRKGVPTGKIKATNRTKLIERDVDLRAALDDYLQVASLHALSEKAAKAHRFAEDPEIVTTFNLDATALRQEGKHRDRLWDEYTEALVEATNTHGPLGVVGNNMSDIVGALRELQIMAVPDDQLRKIPPFNSDVVSISSTVGGRVKAAMESCDVVRGGLQCPDLYSALLWYVHLSGLPLRVCDVCLTAFVSPKAKTCSDRCRQRLRYEKQAGKRA